MNFNFEAFMNCPACGRKYPRASARVVMQKEAYMLLHISCVSCHASSMAFVAKKKEQGNVMSIGSLTDLSFEEVSSMINAKPLTINEVIDICSVINSSKKAESTASFVKKTEDELSRKID